MGNTEDKKICLFKHYHLSIKMHKTIKFGTMNWCANVIIHHKLPYLCSRQVNGLAGLWVKYFYYSSTK